MTSLLALLPFEVLSPLAGLFEWFHRPEDGSASLGWVVGKLLAVVGIAHVLLLLGALWVWVERRASAWIQDRLGPNRVGPQGLLQPIADLGKFLFKEDVVPGHVSRWMYVLAPVLCLVPAMVTFAVIPFTGTVTGDAWVSEQIADLDIGVLYVFAIAGLGVYGIALGGWASNSKYSLLGGVRSSAQMVSYELSLGLAAVSVVLLSSSLRLGDIVAAQATSTWFAFQQPLAFLIFLVASYAETNRLPFDLPEAESELVAGYHTEYSSMKFAFFMLAEYTNMIVAAALVTTLFCGGWTLFGLERAGWAAGAAIFAAKWLFFLFLFVWVRWTLPRFRYDQLMTLGWVWFIPLALGNIVLTATGIAVQRAWVPWVLPAVLVLAALAVAYLAPGRAGARAADPSRLAPETRR